MARIDYKDGVYRGVGTWEERTIWKKHKFRFSKLHGAWITDRDDLAQAVAGVPWTSRAIAHIEGQLRLADDAVKLSYAATTDFQPLVPSGNHPRTGKPFEFLGYQRAGVEYALPRKDCLIADAPGLGKTIVAIGVFNCDPSLTKVLIICPASLKENWRREFDLWKTRDVSVGIAETSHKEKVQDGLYKNGKPKFKTIITPELWPDTDVVVVNYDILDRFPQIKATMWDMLVCDECHALKTPDSGRTLFVLGGNKKKRNAQGRWEQIWFTAVEAKRRLFLSGTPMMNRPVELWPIIHAFDPSGIGKSYEKYVERYCAAWWDNWRGKHGALDVSGASNQEELGQLIRAKFMIRRRKREVLPDLPPIWRQVVVLDTPEIRELVAREDELAQALRLYEKIVRNDMDQFQIDDALGEQIIANAERLSLRDADDAEAGFETRALKMSYAQAITGLEPPAIGILFEELAQVRRELGIAKLSGVVPWTKEFLAGEDKLLMFAYHTDVILGLRDQLAKYNPAVVYGGTPVKKRQPEVDRFQDDERCRLGIMQIDAAGIGFTMTRARDVAFAEEDWVPTKKWQAEDRVCRLGQTADTLTSTSLVANGSMDAKMAQRSLGKEEVFSRVLDS